MKDQQFNSEGIFQENDTVGVPANRMTNGVHTGKLVEEQIPWFPRTLQDLDRFANKIMTCGSGLEADHPGFKDLAYRERREYFAKIAAEHRHGEPIPRVEYTEDEIRTWGIVFRECTRMFPTHACKEFNDIFATMVERCGYNVNNIPQIEDLSNFLRERTGFTIRPVAGLLEPRDFLAGLALRVFHSTQYVRHPKQPENTPEPDVCHELLGHVPMFADPEFAQFSQELGLASLGASDEDVEKLATCYWFTIENGLCRQGDDIRVYGAAILSSFAEMPHSLSDKAKKAPFDPEIASVTPYPISVFQYVYFVAESFEDVKEKMRCYAKKIDRPFTVRYNPYTRSIETLSNRNQIESLIRNLTSEISFLTEASRKL